MCQLHQCFWWPYFCSPIIQVKRFALLKYPLWKAPCTALDKITLCMLFLCMGFVCEKLEILVEFILIRCQRKTSREHGIEHGHITIGWGVGPLSSITHYIRYHSQRQLILEMPLCMCRKILVLAKLVVNTNCSRPCLAQASLSHPVWSKWCLQDLTPEYVIWEHMVTYGNMIISVGGGSSGQDGRRVHVVASAQTRI